MLHVNGLLVGLVAFLRLMLSMGLPLYKNDDILWRNYVLNLIIKESGE